MLLGSTGGVGGTGAGEVRVGGVKQNSRNGGVAKRGGGSGGGKGGAGGGGWGRNGRGGEGGGALRL